MWLGTSDGLYRYDSYNLLVFRSGITNSDLLTNNEITCISEDHNGRLLVGTKRGLNILDKETYRITPFPNEEVISQEIRTLMVASDGEIWVGTLTWVYRFSPDLKQYKKFDHELPVTSVNFIFQDANETIYVFLWDKGMHKYHPETGTFSELPRVGRRNNPFKLFRDDRGRYWLCTWGDGLFLFDPEDSENPYKLVDIPLVGAQRKENIFFGITQDKKDGYIWLMSLTGIRVIDANTRACVHPIDVSEPFTAFSNIFSDIICDKDGNLWIAAFSDGVLAIFMKPFIKDYDIPVIKKMTGFATHIKTVYEDATGDIWIYQNRKGLGIFSPQNNEVKFYDEFDSLKDLDDMGSIGCISGFSSLPGEVWIGSGSATNIYIVKKAGEDVSLTRVIDLKQVTNNPGHPRLFFEDKKQNIWIATTKHLFVKHAGKEDIALATPSLSDISSITDDYEGNLWIATHNSGLYCVPFSRKIPVDKTEIEVFNRGNGKITSNNVETICSDRHGNVWLGNKEGNVLVYNRQVGKFEDLSKTFDMLESGILDIIVDNIGHVWISTSKKIVEYDPDNGRLMHYAASDETVTSAFLHGSCCYGKSSGKLLFGGYKGISVFTPYGDLSVGHDDVEAVITDIRINNKSVFEHNDNVRFKIGQQAVNFSPEDKNIEFHFSSLNYAFAGKQKYAYKLEGFDNDWVYADYLQHSAFYNQLPKGRYHFLVKTMDYNGLWNEKFTRFEIYKAPAFYETWWAGVIYIVLFSLSGYAVYLTAKKRIQLRNELKIAQIEKEKSEELIQVKLRYFTNISHDILTPLTIINCLIDDAETVLKSKLPQFELMKTNVKRLKKLIQQVLDFRKMESGNMKLKVSLNDISAFIKEICSNNFEPLMNRKQINFSFIADSEHIPAYFDVDKMDKIIFNLLSNAHKYTPENGEIRVELNAYQKGDSTWASIKISDTGIGIAPENLNRIFTRFYTDKRGNAVETNGIGLSLTKDLLNLHHGFIEVTSALGKGTAFTVHIPIDRMSYVDSELNIPDKMIYSVPDLMQDMETTPDAEKIDREDTFMLLVEDNEELLTLMYHIFSRRYKVLIAKNGVEAIKVLKSKDVDIIVSDVVMPEMDGLELCRKLKSDLDTSHIPVILLTAKNSTEDRIDCYNVGANGYISKPFDMKLLKARIANFLLNKRQKQREFRFNSDINVSLLQTSAVDKRFLDKAIAVIHDNMIDADFDINTFAEKLCVSKSSLYRKIKSITDISPIEFIRNIRLKYAMRMLREEECTISEAAYSSGFSNPKYFATCFKEEFNMTPSEYLKEVSAGR